MGKVILLEPSSLRLTATEEFGAIHYISTTKFHIFNVDEIIEKTEKVLDELKYDPDKDYICMTGQGTKLAIFVATVASLYEEFTLLMFDARAGRYKERIFKNAES